MYGYKWEKEEIGEKDSMVIEEQEEEENGGKWVKGKG